MSQPSAAPVLLVVDDDREIRNLLSDHLEQHGFRTVKAADGRTMKAALEAGPVDLVVLDLNLPDEDGLSLCRGIRAASKTPVIILTARGDPIDRIVGLEMGADDYMAKPFEPRELVARIRTVLRRTGGEATAVEGRHADFSGWSLDIAARALTAPDGRLAPLSGADFDLLHALVRNGGKPLSRERIRALSTVADADDRAIDLRVSRLRQKLGDDAKAPALIRTVRSLGYMLVGPVTWRA